MLVKIMGDRGVSRYSSLEGEEGDLISSMNRQHYFDHLIRVWSATAYGAVIVLLRSFTMIARFYEDHRDFGSVSTPEPYSHIVGSPANTKLAQPVPNRSRDSWLLSLSAPPSPNTSSSLIDWQTGQHERANKMSLHPFCVSAPFRGHRPTGRQSSIKP